jgi:hypothetical protein
VSPGLSEKLRIKEGSTLVLIDAPAGFDVGLPSGVEVRTQARGKADVVLGFFSDRAKLERRITGLGRIVFPAGSLWVAWPKRSSGVPTDMTDHVVREIALPGGLVDNKVCAVDETWTGLRLVWRREMRGA